VSRRLRLLAATPVLAAGLAACGADTVSAEKVAEGAADALEVPAGARPEVTCDEGLPAEVGAETRCTLTIGDDPEQYGVTATVTSVDGDTVNFDVQVDDEPLE
jgi:Domain of unknown function (DUF4333)